MAKPYTLGRSSSTGWWAWGCKDGDGAGSSPSKSEARAQARAACSGEGIITPPDVDVVAYRGYLSHFTIEDLDGKRNTFSTEEISQAEFSFFFGMPCANDEKVEDSRKLITILKIWGLYRGGYNVETIMKLHYLTPDDVKKLITRRYYGGTIIVEDDGTITWKLP